ncbi:Sel1-like repeat-containing protein kinase family protein [Thiomicrorhabdus arctica]|uniref:Sel1-like repeat-containing protein kinase family protein n=1 Tax=Thiomicrorhabdus arctica TaxID=131540 RepID=UPI000379795A|nr:Sel1-like repeat-containing protein kinase family protein [Thiomicrorhabdus arctica]
MSDSVLTLLEQQPDLSQIKLISTGKSVSVFKVLQKTPDVEHIQVVRVLHNIKNHYAIKREKDLLNYLNQFSEFSRFNEIRKVGFYYLQFFDFAGKRNLQQLIAKKGALSPKMTKNLLANMISSLEKAHKTGFIHGNIKPSNIIQGKKRFILVDWSQSIPSLSSFDTESILGDKRYCPPERLNGELDEKGDIYALGCTIYYALIGKHIYRLDNIEKTSEQLWAQVHHSIRKINRLPIFWRYLILWMTQKNPHKRPTLEELKSWLVDFTVPKWVRKDSLKVKSDYPEDALSILADEHYLYPIFKQALMYEASGDLETAFNLYENCAFRGYSRAENNIGLMYEHGDPINQSYAMAANMYHHAFEKGNPYAAYNLARLFEGGLGMPINLEQAYKLYKFAALRGHLKAQNALGQLYQQGKGTPKNLFQASFWFGMAAHYGHEQARQNLEELLQR